MDETIRATEVMDLVEAFKKDHGLYPTYQLLKAGMEALVEDLIIAADEKTE